MGRLRRPKILNFPLKIMILKENGGIIDLWDRSNGSWEVPRGFMVPKWVYYGGTYDFMRISGGFARNFVGNWEGKGDFR